MLTYARLLTHEQCLDRLLDASVGRVAVTHRALPAIVPVNYVLSGSQIIFRTEPEGMLATGCDGTVVAFEVDEVEADGMAGWSVLVVGMAELLSHGSDIVRATETGLVSAAGAGRDQFVAITIGQLTGRVIDPVAA